MRLKSENIGVKNADIGVKNADFGVKNADIGVKNADIGVKNADLASKHLFDIVKHDIISISNNLPSLIFNLSLYEFKLLLYVINNKHFNYKEYNNYCKITHENLKKTVRKLSRQVISIYDNNEQWADIPCLSNAVYNRGNINIKINPTLEALFYPQKNFFQLNLSTINKIESIFTLKLFLLFKSIYKLNKVNIEFNRLQIYLCTKYKYQSHFIRDIILPNIVTLKKLDINITFTKKNGVFTFLLSRRKEIIYKDKDYQYAHKEQLLKQEEDIKRIREARDKDLKYNENINENDIKKYLAWKLNNCTNEFERDIISDRLNAKSFLDLGFYQADFKEWHEKNNKEK